MCSQSLHSDLNFDWNKWSLILLNYYFLQENAITSYNEELNTVDDIRYTQINKGVQKELTALGSTIENIMRENNKR